jgi:ATP-dependent protease ClpP protease subunit
MKSYTLSGIIGYDVTSNDISAFLKEANGEEVTLFIHSPGGYVYDAIAIFNLIKNYSGKVEVRILSLAASAASYICMAADKISIHPNSIFMIHNAWLLSIGDHNQLREDADYIEKISSLLITEYSKKSGKSVDQIRQLMNDETFLFGEEIISEGFADELIQDDNNSGKEESLAIAKEQITSSLEVMKQAQNITDDLFQAAALLNETQIQKNDNELVQLDKSETLKFMQALSDSFIALDKNLREFKTEISPRIKPQTYSNNIDSETVESFLNKKIEEGKLFPSQSKQILEIISIINSANSLTPNANDLPLNANNFTDTILTHINNLIDTFPQHKLLEDIAKNPNTFEHKEEEFPFAEVDPRSREIHRQALQLMKENKSDYITAVSQLIQNTNS